MSPLLLEQGHTGIHIPVARSFLLQKERGFIRLRQPARLLQKGDYVEIPSDIVHWHGATPDSEFSHIAISLNTDLGEAVWSGPVTDDEYEVK